MNSVRARLQGASRKRFWRMSAPHCFQEQLRHRVDRLRHIRRACAWVAAAQVRPRLRERPMWGECLAQLTGDEILPESATRAGERVSHKHLVSPEPAPREAPVLPSPSDQRISREAESKGLGTLRGLPAQADMALIEALARDRPLAGQVAKRNSEGDAKKRRHGSFSARGRGRPTEGSRSSPTASAATARADTSGGAPADYLARLAARAARRAQWAAEVAPVRAAIGGDQAGQAQLSRSLGPLSIASLTSQWLSVPAGPTAPYDLIARLVEHLADRRVPASPGTDADPSATAQLMGSPPSAQAEDEGRRSQAGRIGPTATVGYGEGEDDDGRQGIGEDSSAVALAPHQPPIVEPAALPLAERPLSRLPEDSSAPVQGLLSLRPGAEDALQSDEDLSDLQTKIRRILEEEARRYGIDV